MQILDSIMSIRAITANNISDMIFDHIESKSTYPIEKVKLLIENYVKSKQEKEKHIDTLKFQYAEKYESQRNVQDELYKTYMIERKDLYDKWLKSKSKADLHNLLEMGFDYSATIWMRRARQSG